MLRGFGLREISYGRKVLQSEVDIAVVPPSRQEDRVILIHIVTDRRGGIQNQNLVKQFVPRDVRGHGNERMDAIVILNVVSLEDMEQHEIIRKTANAGAHLAGFEVVGPVKIGDADLLKRDFRMSLILDSRVLRDQ
jgi:hypothetical protein